MPIRLANGTVEAAGPVQAPDRRVGVQPETADKGGAVHDEFQGLVLTGAVKRLLEESGVVAAAAPADIAIEARTSFAGEDGKSFHGFLPPPLRGGGSSSRQWQLAVGMEPRHTLSPYFVPLHLVSTPCRLRMRGT